RTDGSGELTTVEVTDGTTTVTVDATQATIDSATGQFTLSGVDLSGKGLVDGVLTVKATATDAAGNTSTGTGQATLDAHAPDAPVLTAPSPSNDLTPTLHGTGEPGSTITFTDGTNALGHTVVGTDGKFSFTPTTDLHEGSQVTATATDTAGNVSPATTVDTNIDTTIGQTTVEMTDGTVGSVDHPNNDIDTTEMSSVSISGSIDHTDGTEQLTSLSISDGTHVMTLDPQSVTVNQKTGQFTLSGVDLTGHSFTDGTLTVTAIATDAAGNTSPASATVTLDTSAPTAPTVDAILPGNDLTPTIKGTGEVGSTITFTDGTNELGHVVVGSQGTFSFTPSTDLKEGDHITVTSIDKAGNTSPEVKVASNIDTSIQPTTVDMTDGTVDSVDHPNHDIGATEMSSVSISGSIDHTDGTEQLTSLSISDGTHVMTLDPQSVTINSQTGQFTLSGVDLTGHSFTDGTLTVTAIATDAAGNTSPASATVTLDTSAPTAPTVDAILPGNDLKPTITGTGEVGSTITFTDGTNELGHVVVGSQGTFSFTPSTDLKEGDHITVTSTDKAGNTSPEVKVASNIDTTPGSISFDKNISGDNVLNHVEQGQDLVISGTTTGIENAQVVTVHFNGQDYPSTVTDGKWSVTVDKAELTGLKEGESLSITADVKDVAGNAAQQAIHSLVVDTSVNAPTIYFESTGTDSVYNQAEVGTDNTITATIDLPTDAVAGDTVTIDGTARVLSATDITAQHITQEVSPGASVTASITDQAGNVSALITETAASADVTPPTALVVSLKNDTGHSATDLITSDGALQIAGTEQGAYLEYSLDGGYTWTSGFTPVEGHNSVSVRQVDVAGNVSAASNELVFTLDNAVTAPIVALTHDTGTSATDARTNDGALDITGTEVGATVEYSIDGGTTWTDSFTAVEGGNSVAVRQTDAAGNVSAETQFSFTLDTQVTAPSIHFESTGTDSVYNQAEVGVDNTITATIDLPTDAVAGDTVTIDGTARVLSATDITAQHITQEVSPGASVTASITDQAGNVSTPAAAAVPTADTTPPSVSVQIASVATDDIINISESQQSTIAVTGVVTGEFNSSDKVTVTIDKTPYSGSIDGSGHFTVDVPTNEFTGHTQVEASITTQDTAGNTGSDKDSHSYIIATDIPLITLDPIASGNDRRPAISGHVEVSSHKAIPQDTEVDIQITGDANTYRVHTMNGQGDFELPKGALLQDLPEGSSDITATVTDKAGNVGMTAEPVVVDITAGKITIDDHLAKDDVINHAEQGQDLIISGTTSGIEDGQLVTVNFNGQNYPGSVSGGIWSATVDKAHLVGITDGSTLVITADVNDVAGNKAIQAHHDLGVDLSASATIQVDPLYPINHNTTGNVMFTGSVSGDAQAGDVITVEVNGQEFTGQVLAKAGHLGFGVDVPTSVLKAHQGTYSVSVTLKGEDSHGNTYIGTSQQDVTVDSVEGTIAINDHLANDDVINHAEQGQDLVISGTTSGIEDGQVVTVHFNHQDYTTTVQGNQWSATVDHGDLANLNDSANLVITANVNDKAGNPAVEASHNLGVDTHVGVPTIQFPTPTSTSGEYNAAEVAADGTIEATIVLPADAVAGDILTIGHVDQILSTADISAQQVKTQVTPGATVTATLTDQSENMSSPATETAPTADTTPPSVSVQIESVATDDIINISESQQSTIAVTGVVTGEFNSSDKVTVTIDKTPYSGSIDGSGHFTVDVPTNEFTG
ncbi:Ig-like domain-containing protein, partial [Vibrio ezurae]|uniref:Ig-like domain-containing protein n=1 Tax=Vibrio ezurae TaxID=252583 RepID=UPI0005934673